MTDTQVIFFHTDAMTCTHPYSHILINIPIHTIYVYYTCIHIYSTHITYAMTCTHLYSHTCSYMHIHYMYKYVCVPHMCHGTLILVLTHAYTLYLIIYAYIYTYTHTNVIDYIKIPKQTHAD